MEEIKLLRRGAESLIYLGEFLGIKAVYKVRPNKSYRDPKLDRQINSLRTISEAKLMYSALKAGINTPALLLVCPEKFTIVMEYIEGTMLKNLGHEVSLFKDVGIMAGKLHLSGIVHGDLTTNNIIVKEGELFLIDFGLAKRSTDIEDMATDVHVFLRSLESIHPDVRDRAFSAFVEGYDTVTHRARDILKKVNEIRMRGRYVEERRTKGSNR